MMAIITVMFGFGRNILVVILPFIIEQYQINYTQAANIIALHQGMYLVMSLVSGVIALKYNPVHIISISVIISSVLIFAIGLSTQYWQIAIIYGGLGGLIACAWVPMVRFVSLTMNAKERVFALSIAACGTAVGFVINGLGAIIILKNIGYSELWAIAGLITFLIGITAYFSMKSLVDTRVANINYELDVQKIVDIKINRLNEHQKIQFFVILFLCGLGLVTFQSYYSAYLIESRITTEIQAGWLWTISGCLGVISGIILSVISNKYSVKSTILICLIILSAAIVSMALFNNVIAAVIAAITYGMFYFGLFGLFPAFLTNLLNEEQASKIFGRSNLFVGLGSVLGGIVGGWIMFYYGNFRWLWLASAIASLMAAILMNKMPSDKHSDKYSDKYNHKMP